MVFLVADVKPENTFSKLALLKVAGAELKKAMPYHWQSWQLVCCMFRPAFGVPKRKKLRKFGKMRQKNLFFGACTQTLVKGFIPRKKNMFFVGKNIFSDSKRYKKL